MAPSRMDDPEVFQGNFLFVNKNATNVKSRSPDEAFTIGSHVCGKYARWRKVARVKSRRVTHFPQSGLVSIPPDPDSVIAPKDRSIQITVKENSNARTHERETATARKRPGLMPSSSVPGSFRRQSSTSSASRTDEEAEPAQRSANYISNPLADSKAGASAFTRAGPKSHFEMAHRSLCPSPRTLLQKGNSDPFSAAALPITSSINFLISVWQGVYLETVWPVDAGAASRTPALVSWQNDCRDAVANEARLHGLLAWTLMLQISSLPKSPNRSKLLLEYFMHKNKCLESLRGDLSRGASHSNMVPLLWHLTGAEFYAGDLRTATVHFTALKAMVESCGGLHVLPWAMQKLVIVADMTLSQIRMEPLLFSVDEWDPGSIFPLLSHAEAEHLAASPQLTGNSRYHLPAKLADIFRDYRELMAVYELVDTIPDEFRRTELLCWAQLRQYALNSRVTRKGIDITAAPEVTKDRASELCTCVAVDYFQQLIWHTRYKARTEHVPFHHPRPSFDDLLPNKDLVSPHLTPWIYFLAATVEQINCCHDSQQKETRHAHRFFAWTKKSGLRSAHDLRRIFNDFLYHSETLDRYLIALLARAEQLHYGSEEMLT